MYVNDWASRAKINISPKSYEHKVFCLSVELLGAFEQVANRLHCVIIVVREVGVVGDRYVHSL